MAEKKTEAQKKNEKKVKEEQEKSVKKTTPKKSTTSKTKSSSSVKKSPTATEEKKTPSKTTKKSTPKKESTTTKTKKIANSKSVTKTETNKKKASSTSKKKESTIKTKETSKVKIKENSSKNKTNDVKSKKEPIKKIVSKKKVLGKQISSSKKEEKENQFIKTITLLLKKLNVDLKKVGSFFKNSGSKITIKTKEVLKTGISSLKKKTSNAKEFFITKFRKINEKHSQDQVNNEIQSKKQEQRKKTITFSLKEKTRRTLIGVSISCLLLSVLLMIPYGVSTYKSGASNKTLEVPKFMKPKEECCNYSVTFSSPRSIWAIKKDIEKIMNSYERLNCDGKNYYYNAKENYTITEYGVNKGLFFNEVYFTYGIGNSCNMDTKFKKLELLDADFSIEDAKKDGNFVMEGGKIYNKNAYDDFMTNVNAKIPSTLRIVTTTKEGDVIITDLSYLNDGKYMVSYDATRDRNNKNSHSITAYKFEHLKWNKNKLYAYNGDKLVIKNTKKYETFYLLTIPNE